MPETIYSQKDAFFLEIDGFDLKIREPQLWSKVEASISRNLKTHGVDVNFPSKDSPLEYSDDPDEESGLRSKTLIDNVFNTKGPDGDIVIKFGTWDGVTFTEITRQKIDLSKGYENGLHLTKASVTNLSAKQRILDHIDTPVNLDDIEDILGVTLSGAPAPLPQENINLHSQVLIKITEQTNPNQTISDGIEYDINDGSFGDFKTYFLQYAFQDKIKSDGFEDFNIPNGISALDPIANLKANFRAEVSGTITINAPTSLKALLNLDIGVGFNVIGNYTTYIKVGTQANQREFIIGSGAINIITSAAIETINTQAEVDTDFEIPYVVKGDYVWIYTLVDISGGSGAKVSSVQFRHGFFKVPPTAPFDKFHDQQIQMTFDTYASASVNPAYRLVDAIRYMFYVLTGDNDTFKVDSFFDSLGAGYDFHFLNGYLLRSINTQNKRPSINAEELFESVNMMWGLGQNIEIDNDGNVNVVWEEVEHFYQDHEVLDLSDNTWNFRIVSNKESSINTVKFSYPRLSVRETDGGGSIDAINTEIQSSLPLETGRKKYSKRNNLRTEGYEIESARRTSVIDKESVNTDEDGFVINTKELFTFATIVTFNEEFKQITIPESAFEFFRRVGRLDITGTASNNITITYDIDNLVVESGPILKIVVNEDLVDEVNINSTFTATGSLSKQNEDFDKTVFVDGLTETAKDDNYNVILQPMRTLIQHSKWVNQAVVQKVKTLLYKTLKHLNADNFRSQLNVGATHVYGDIGRVEVSPQDSIAIEDCYEGKSIITNRRFMFSAEISREQFALLTESQRGQGATPYGYISTRNNDGEKVSAWIIDVSGEPNENTYDLILAEKGDFYG
jgi:hypothetical protein